MSIRHGWDWQPPQTAFHINLRYIQSVWAHWYVVHGNTVAALHRYTHITLLRFWVLGHYLWSQHDVITSWLRLTATSNCFPHQYLTYTKCLSTLICCPWEYSSSLTQLYPHYLAQILGTGSLPVESKWCYYVMVEADSHLKLLPVSMWDIYKVFEHIDMLSMGIQ